MATQHSTLKPEELQALRAASRSLTREIAEERFVKKDDGRYVFRAMCRTSRSMAGSLDVDSMDAASVPAAVEPQYEFVEITLISPKDFEYTPKLTDADKKAAKPIDKTLDPHKAYYMQDRGLLAPASAQTEGEAAELPAVIDHRINQSPVKNQGGRGTCVSHACMGLLERVDDLAPSLKMSG